MDNSPFPSIFKNGVRLGVTCLMGKRWSKDDILLLEEYCKGKTYKEIQKVFPNRSIESLQVKCRELGLNKHIINPSFKWCEQEEKILRQNYSNTTIENLVELLPLKSERSIVVHANRMGLKKNIDTHNKIRQSNSRKSALFWDDEKTKLLIETFEKYGINEVYTVFKKHDVRFIDSKLRENNIIENTNGEKIKLLFGIDNFTDISDSDLLIMCENILNRNLDSYQPLSLNEYQVKECFIYFLSYKNIKITKENILNIKFGELLNECKLKSFVKKLFGNYYEFTKYCFPNFNLKRWEFKYLDVPNGFWDNKYNCFEAISHYLNNMITDEIISSYVDILGVSHKLIEKYFTRSMFNAYPFSELIISFLKTSGIDYSEYNYKIYDDILFDSKEERDIFVLLKQYFGNNIRKAKRKDILYNEKYNESYIPDFLVGDNIIIEYYGLYKDEDIKDNKILIDYKEKTLRKNDFYKSLNDITFIPLYPIDLKNNLKTLSLHY